MRHDPLFTSWLVRCPSPEACQRLQKRLTAELHPDATYTDVVRGPTEGAAPAATRLYRLGDYFAGIRLIAAGPELPSAFRIVFQRRPDAGREWKDLMVRVLQEVRKECAGTTTLEYRGDEEPAGLGAAR